MATDKNYLIMLQDQLSRADWISFRPMMGEYLIYCYNKVVGGLYDNRLLVKQTPAAKQLLPDAPVELPYEGAKGMLAVTDIENTELLLKLFEAIFAELPEPKPRRRTKHRS